MGSEYIPDTKVNLKESFSESTAQTPLILTHSYGEPSTGDGSSLTVLAPHKLRAAAPSDNPNTHEVGDKNILSSKSSSALRFFRPDNAI